MEPFQNLGFFAKLTLLMALVPLAMASAYLVRPSERRLALMRPLSLAALFGALSAGVVGFLNTLRSIGLALELSVDFFRGMALGAAEALAPMFVGFACLAAAWLFVAVGMSRSRLEP